MPGLCDLIIFYDDTITSVADYKKSSTIISILGIIEIQINPNDGYHYLRHNLTYLIISS